jgi:hypothetical protein
MPKANSEQKGASLMKKTLNILIIAIILITGLSGCGGGSSSGSGDEKTVTTSGILTLLSSYETAVEAYDVDGMLDCLDSGSFTLTIKEGRYTSTKDYATLKKELEDDENNQLMWRKDSTVAGGHNYQLDLILGTPTSGNETSSGAIVKQNFEVWESSAEVTPAIRTDSGTIVWTLVYSSGEWQATALTINYNTSITGSRLVKTAAAATSSQGKRFGFGKMGF